MTENFQQDDAAESKDQCADQNKRPNWVKPEVVRISAGSAELDFNGPDDGLGQTS